MNEPRITPINKDTAKALGTKGGRARTPRKTAANKINPLKNGSQTKDPKLQALLSISPTEKAMGIKRSDKIMKLKKAGYSFFASNSEEEFIAGMEEFVAQSMHEIDRKRVENKSVGRDITELLRVLSDIFLLRYGRKNRNENLNMDVEAFQSEYVIFRTAVLNVLQARQPSLLQPIATEYHRIKEERLRK